METGISSKVLEEICSLAIKYNVDYVLLFGSRARGDFRPRSDIDLAVKGAKDIELLRAQIESIPTLRSFDIVDLDSCKNQLLLREIVKNGRKIL